MDCNIITDLLPLYIDGCCSEESARLVEDHLNCCNSCRAALEDMKTLTEPLPHAPVTLRKVSDWKASVLQSVLLFLSFGIITVGVALEAGTPSGLLNGFWAMNLVIPATGFMLSLANWYFVRLYKSRKLFAVCSATATLAITLCAYIWAGAHYEITWSDLQECWVQLLSLHRLGVLLTAVFCVLSGVLSNIYGRMLGKE